MLNSKQRTFLRSLAHSYEPVVMVGKGGADSVIKSADDALTARELIKCRALEACPTTARETAETVARAARAEVVLVIGRCFVLYRPNAQFRKDTDSVSYRLKKMS